MRIDYQHGDHLRIGSVIVARARQVESAPLVDGGTTRLIRVDEGCAVDLAAAARSLCEILHAGTTVGPTLDGLVDADALDAAANVRGALCAWDEERVVEHFGSLVFHRRGSSRAVAVGWLDAHAPMVYRWRPRRFVAHVRWVLAGRPLRYQSIGGDAAGASFRVTSTP